MLSMLAGLLSGVGGWVAAGVAALAGVLAYGWRREAKGREQARNEAQQQRSQADLDALKTRMDVDRETRGLDDAAVRDELRRWTRPDA